MVRLSCCSNINITPQSGAKITVGGGINSSVGVSSGNVSEEIRRHNLDEHSHPFILNNYSSHEYTAQEIEEHNTSPDAHIDIRAKFNTFIHNQGVASDYWHITHNMDKYPSVTVVDSANNEIVAEVHYVDRNNLIVTMNGASKGKAYLN